MRPTPTMLLQHTHTHTPRLQGLFRLHDIFNPRNGLHSDLSPAWMGAEKRAKCTKCAILKKKEINKERKRQQKQTGRCISPPGRVRVWLSLLGISIIIMAYAYAALPGTGSSSKVTEQWYKLWMRCIRAPWSLISNSPESRYGAIIFAWCFATNPIRSLVEQSKTAIAFSSFEFAGSLTNRTLDPWVTRADAARCLLRPFTSTVCLVFMDYD